VAHTSEFRAAAQAKPQSVRFSERIFPAIFGKPAEAPDQKTNKTKQSATYDLFFSGTPCAKRTINRVLTWSSNK
jgi:hypothetical protein